MARVHFKARFFVIIIILVLLLVAGLYFLLFSDHEEELALGTLRLDYEAETVIIRDEINVPTEKFDKIIFDVVEGAVVEDGTQIAQVFRWGYQDSSMQSLLDVRKQLLNYQFTKTEGIINTDIDMANAQINQKLSEIRSTVREDSKTDLLSLELLYNVTEAKRKELPAKYEKKADLFQSIGYQRYVPIAQSIKDALKEKDMAEAQSLLQKLGWITENNSRLAERLRSLPAPPAPYKMQQLPLLEAIRTVILDERAERLSQTEGWQAEDYRATLQAYSAFVTETLTIPFAMQEDH